MDNMMHPDSKVTLASKHLFSSKIMTYCLLNSSIHELMTSHLSPITYKANYCISKTDAHIDAMKTSTELQAFRISVHLKSYFYCMIVIGFIHSIDSKISKTIGTVTVNKK